MHWRRGNPSQPPDLTVPHQGAGDGDRYPNERNDHDHRDVEIDHIQAGVADRRGDGSADETENDQQDGRKPNTDTESRWLTERELRLHLKQRGEPSARSAAKYSAEIRRHTWTSSDAIGVVSLVSLMKASSRFPLLASSSDTWIPLAARAFSSDAARSPVPVTVT